MSTRYAAARGEYETWLAARHAPRYRAEQVWRALYVERRRLEDVTNLPADLRAELAAAFPVALTPARISRGDRGTTTKWLLAATDGRQIETVLMEHRTRATVCVSTQAGCAMGCTFCATGQAGFERNLTDAEIVEQVMLAAQQSTAPVTNVVLMGMGEPLANYGPTVAALRRLHHDMGISARRLTVSTVGMVGGIRRLATEDLPVTLAVSLHAPTDELRASLLPIDRRYPLTELLAAVHDFARARGRRVTFEYAVIEGVNDLPEHAHQLGELLRPLGPLGRHVNLIPLNPTTDFDGRAPAPAAVAAFAAAVEAAGLTPTVRHNRGTDIDAACGQLRQRARGSPTGPSARMQP